MAVFRSWATKLQRKITEYQNPRIGVLFSLIIYQLTNLYTTGTASSIGRSDSWKFSSDYKLSRKSASLIESIEFDMDDETMNDMDPEDDEIDENVQEMLDVRANLRRVSSGDGGRNAKNGVDNNRNLDGGKRKINKTDSTNNSNNIKSQDAGKINKTDSKTNNNSNLQSVWDSNNDNSSKNKSQDSGKNNDNKTDNQTIKSNTKSNVKDNSSTNNKSLYAPKKLKPKSKDREWKSKSLHSIFTPRDDTETDIDSVDDNELTDIFKR